MTREKTHLIYICIQERTSLYSDAGTLVLRDNRIELLSSGAVDASVRNFVFSSNVVDRAEDDALSVACLHGRVEDNVFALKGRERKQRFDFNYV